MIYATFAFDALSYLELGSNGLAYYNIQGDRQFKEEIDWTRANQLSQFVGMIQQLLPSCNSMKQDSKERKNKEDRIGWGGICVVDESKQKIPDFKAKLEKESEVERDSWGLVEKRGWVRKAKFAQQIRTRLLR